MQQHLSEGSVCMVHTVTYGSSVCLFGFHAFQPLIFVYKDGEDGEDDDVHVRATVCQREIKVPCNVMG